RAWCSRAAAQGSHDYLACHFGQCVLIGVGQTESVPVKDHVVGQDGPQPAFECPALGEFGQLSSRLLEGRYPGREGGEGASVNEVTGWPDIDGHQLVDGHPQLSGRGAVSRDGALPSDPAPDVSLLVPVLSSGAHQHAAEEDSQFPASQRAAGHRPVQVREDVMAIAMEQLVGDVHADRPAERNRFGLVDGGPPTGEPVLRRRAVQDIREVRQGGAVAGNVPKPPRRRLANEEPAADQPVLLGTGQRWPQDAHRGVLGRVPFGEVDDDLRPVADVHTGSFLDTPDQTISRHESQPETGGDPEAAVWRARATPAAPSRSPKHPPGGWRSAAAKRPASASSWMSSCSSDGWYPLIGMLASAALRATICARPA